MMRGCHIKFSVTNANKPAVTAPVRPPSSSPLITVQSYHGYNYTAGGGHVTGTAINTTDRTLANARLAFGLYDKDGKQVGSTLATTNTLAPHGTWQFDAVYSESNVASIQVRDTSAN